MNSVYLYSNLGRRIARTATFIVAAAAILEPPPPQPLPEGAPHVTVALTTYRAQTSRFFSPQIADDAVVIVEANELHPDQRSVTLGKSRYGGATFARAPQIAEEPITSPEGVVNLQIPLVSPRPNRNAITPPVTIADFVAATPEEVIKRRAVWIPDQPYRRPFIGIKTPQLEDTVPEADNCLVIFTEYENRSRITTLAGVPPENVVPPQDLPEGWINLQIASATQRPNRNVVRLPQPQEAAPVEADELASSRRSITLAPKLPYRGNTVTVSREPLEPEELATDRRAVYLKSYPYRGNAFVRQPQLEDAVIVEAPELHPSRRSITLGKQPYLGKTFTVAPKVIPEPQVIEYDERIQSRVVVLRGTYPKPGKPFVYFRQPPEGDEAGIIPSRQSVYTPTVPYRGESVVFTKTQEEPDELLRGRRLVYLPTAPYRGKTFVGAPPSVAIEYDELQLGRRSIIVPTEARVKGYAYTRYAVVETDELMRQRRVSIYLPQPYRSYPWRSGHPIQFDDSIYPSLPDLVRTSTRIADLPHSIDLDGLPYTTRLSGLPHSTRKTSEET